MVIAVFYRSKLIISCAKSAHDPHSSLVNHAGMLTRLHSLYQTSGTLDLPFAPYISHSRRREQLCRMHKGMLKAENIFQQRFCQIPRTCKKVQSLDLSIKTLHLRQTFLITDYQLVFGFFRIMSFYILDDFEYFVTAHTLFFQLSNEINDFFACHVFTHFPPPPFQVVLYHSAKPLFNYQSTVFIFREFIVTVHR